MVAPTSVKAPPGWSLTPDGKRMRVEVETEDFLAALALFEEIGEIAEAIEHHPDLHLEKWNQVRIETYSHDVGHLTARDVRLAERVGALLRSKGLLGA